MPALKKTHCKHGHEFTPENTKVVDGYKECITCRRARYVKKGYFSRPLEVRFWEKVNKAPGLGPNGDCWEWTASTSYNGYGVIRIGGRAGRQVNSHRLSYEMNNGKIPAGLLVRHTCDNPSCVNPSHLILGTCKDNAADMMERGRNWQLRITHCPHGHEYSEGNTVLRAGKRQCRTCERGYKKNRIANAKAAIQS